MAAGGRRTPPHEPTAAFQPSALPIATCAASEPTFSLRKRAESPLQAHGTRRCEEGGLATAGNAEPDETVRGLGNMLLAPGQADRTVPRK